MILPFSSLSPLSMTLILTLENFALFFEKLIAADQSIDPQYNYQYPYKSLGYQCADLWPGFFALFEVSCSRPRWNSSPPMSHTIDQSESLCNPQYAARSNSRLSDLSLCNFKESRLENLVLHYQKSRSASHLFQ